MLSISSAHSLHVRGARGPAPWGLDEVDESRRVVDRVEALLRSANVTVRKFHDNSSRSQSANLTTITNWHQQRPNDRQVSVHFNAHTVTESPRGTEVLHRNQPTLAANVSLAIASAGRFINRGAKVRTNLAFLSRLSNAILIEVGFVDSRADATLYRENFEAICRATAESISGRTISPQPPPVQPPSPTPTPPPPIPAPPATAPPTTSRPTLRNGSRGEDVRDLQRLLNRHGASPPLIVDGSFGGLTEAAVRSFQTKHALVSDGIVGVITWGRLLA